MDRKRPKIAISDSKNQLSAIPANLERVLKCLIIERTKPLPNSDLLQKKLSSYLSWVPRYRPEKVDIAIPTFSENQWTGTGQKLTFRHIRKINFWLFWPAWIECYGVQL